MESLLVYLCESNRNKKAASKKIMLSGLEIKRYLDEQIKIEPFDIRCLDPNSYNLKLADELLVYDQEVLDMHRKNSFHKI